MENNTSKTPAKTQQAANTLSVPSTNTTQSQSNNDLFKKWYGGRIGKREYWIGIMTMYGISLLTMLIYFFLYLNNPELARNNIVETVIPSIVSIITYAIQLSFIIRRLHDIGKSGLLSLITIIPGVSTIFIIIIGIQEGEPYPNKYGPVPSGSQTM